jgi:hypothetical protein
MDLNAISNYVVQCDYGRVDPFEIFKHMKTEDIIVKKYNTYDHVKGNNKKAHSFDDIEVEDDNSPLFKGSGIDRAKSQKVSAGAV